MICDTSSPLSRGFFCSDFLLLCVNGVILSSSKQKQIRRCHEILKFAEVRRSGDQEMLQANRLCVKNRLYNDYLEYLKPLELIERKSKLAILYEQLVKEYQSLIDSLSARSLL